MNTNIVMMQRLVDRNRKAIALSRAIRGRNKILNVMIVR